MYQEIVRGDTENSGQLLSVFEDFTDAYTFVQTTRDDMGNYPLLLPNTSNSSTRDDRDSTWVTYPSIDAYALSVIRGEGDAYRTKMATAQEVTKQFHTGVGWYSVNYKRRRTYASMGSTLHMSRVWAGKAPTAFSVRRRQARLDHGGIVTIMIPTDCAYNVSEERIFLHRLAAYALVSILEQSGKRAEVWAYGCNGYVFGPSEVSKPFPRTHTLLQRVKRAGQIYTIRQLAPIMFADFNRRLTLRVLESVPTMHPCVLDTGYGYADGHKIATLDILQKWAGNHGIDTDTMVFCPHTSNSGIYDIERMCQWVQETLDALNN